MHGLLNTVQNVYEINDIGLINAANVSFIANSC